MLFSKELISSATPIMTAIHQHPFVQGIGDGFVEDAALISYVEQDYRYLTEFIKIYAGVVTKLNDRLEMKYFTNSMDFILNSESHPHHIFCDIAGVKYESLQHAQPSPKAYLYESHMHRAVQTGSILNILCAFQPCPWTYSEIADKLVKEHKNSNDNPFKEWIEFYHTNQSQSPEEKTFTEKFFNWIDKLAANASPKELKTAKKFFLISCELEFEFWEQTFYQQNWRFANLIGNTNE